ncbi:MAG: O-antigen ligase family protein [Kiritimatiellae bacterium]|nr:O-antigen ligase family protein [Kiritimatiellia bacterium]
MRGRITLVGLALLGAYFLSTAIARVEISVLIGVALFFAAVAVAFIRGTDALYLVIFAILFSPELGSGVATGKTGGEGTALVVRAEDVLLVAVGLGWMLRSAYIGRRFGIVRSPVNAAIWWYMTASIIATLLGVIGGTVRPKSGLFHNLKYFEYFFLYFMILAHVRQRRAGIRMIWALLVVFFFAMIYGYTQIGTGGRLVAPFDAEPNTFGGYIVLMMCLAVGIALEDRRVQVRTAMVLLVLFATPVLLFTLSRASYIALTAAVFAFLIFSRHRLLVASIMLALVIALAVGLPLLPDRVQKRVTGTFERGTQYHVQIAGIDLDPSASARVISYRKAIEVWADKPLFGHGVTGTLFVDGQFVRILAETGVFGLGAFLYIFARLLGEVRRVTASTRERFFKGVAMGFQCGVFAMLAHALGANSFIIIRIAEPFWSLAALVLIIPRFEAEAEAETQPDAAAAAVARPYAEEPAPAATWPDVSGRSL